MIPLGLFDFALFTNPSVFLIVMVVLMGGLGLASMDMYIAGACAYMTFMYVAINTDLALFTNISYILVVLVSIFFGLKIWQFTTGGEPA